MIKNVILIISTTVIITQSTFSQYVIVPYYNKMVTVQHSINAKPHNVVEKKVNIIEESTSQIVTSSATSSVTSQVETPPVTSTVSNTSSTVSTAPTKNVRYVLTEAQRDRIERIVMTASRGSDIELSIGVAQVMLNRIESGRFGPTVEAVINAKNQFEIPWSGQVNQDVKNAVSRVFDNGEVITSTPIYYYNNPYYSSKSFGRGKIFVIQEGSGKQIHYYWTEK